MEYAICSGICSVSTVVVGFLVDWHCFIERFFIIRNLRQSPLNRLWDVVDNTGHVIRFHVDIEWVVIRLVIWHVFTTGELEGDIEEVMTFLLALIVILRPCLPKMLHRSFLVCSAC